MTHDPQLPSSFRGVVRLFPLPNLVLFPQVIQPLHIFEPRYRQMLADALDDDRLLAMALLKPGWEEGYHLAPPIHPVVCVGRVFQEERLADGRYNLLLHGLARARVVEELDTAKLYRSARVELLPEVPAPPAVGPGLRRRLGEQMTRWLADQEGALPQLRKLLEGPLTLGALCDVFAYALPVGVEAKQQLLEEPQAEARVRRLLSRLEETPPPKGAPPAPRPFPPEFSPN
jgi:Lon protease-like protein